MERPIRGGKPPFAADDAAKLQRFLGFSTENPGEAALRRGFSRGRP
jgi:hypothetical protein